MAFKATPKLYIKGYFTAGTIQYNKKLRHFRCIKSYKPWENLIIDGGKIIKVEQEER
jgi:hypothetical protein